MKSIGVLILFWSVFEARVITWAYNPFYGYHYIYQQQQINQQPIANEYSSNVYSQQYYYPYPYQDSYSYSDPYPEQTNRAAAAAAPGSAEEAIMKLNELFAMAPTELLQTKVNENRNQFPTTQKPIQEEETSTLPIHQLIDVRFGENSTNAPPTTTTSNVIDLNYKPTRPFYAPDPVFYPKPSITNAPSVPNRFPQLETTTPISLEFKPSRPSFAPNPVIYPQPINRPEGMLSNRYPELGGTTTYPNSQTDTPTSWIVTNRPPKTTIRTTTPISLEYKPSRPPYVPDPVVYPMPVIKPGTPWPAE